VVVVKKLGLLAGGALIAGGAFLALRNRAFAPSSFTISESAFYNDQPPGQKLTTAHGFPISIDFVVGHVGSGETVYVGYAIVKSGDSLDRAAYWKSVPLTVGDDEEERNYEVSIEDVFPSLDYYRPGTYDVFRFVSSAEPPPYKPLDRMDDDWDRDVFQVVEEPASFQLSDAEYNGEPAGSRVRVLPDGLWRVSFDVIHTGPEADAFWGVVLTRGDINDTPTDGWRIGYVGDISGVSDDAAPTSYPANTINTWPEDVYFQQKGTYNVYRFVSSKRPTPKNLRREDILVERLDRYCYEFVGGEQRVVVLDGSGDKRYNGRLAGSKVQIRPGDLYTIEWAFQHQGPATTFYVGTILVRSRLFGHGNPSDVPLAGWTIQSWSVEDHPEPERVPVTTRNYLPPIDYYSSGAFDVLRFVSDRALVPGSYSALDDNWDEDCYEVIL
jgi:hypothetical protein